MGELQWFRPAQGGATLGVANLTNEPTVRHWANYHNANCWNPDGRYVAYTRFASNGVIYGTPEAAEVHLFDLHTGEDCRVGNGFAPRWAHHHDWLFYVRVTGDTPDTDAPLGTERNEVWWLDVASGEQTLAGRGLTDLGGVSHDDQWLFGARSHLDGGGRHGFRLRIQAGGDAQPEYLAGLDRAGQYIPNPRHGVVFARIGYPDAQSFAPTRYWFDLDGSNIRVASVNLERCHQSWLGNGEYYLLGNSQVRGRRWDQPFPSSLHFLANARTGDISPCGRSGRFVVGDKPLTIADLRSGDGWRFLEDLSVVCYPSRVLDDSGPYDSDAKGSPDGTKVCFVSNYDLRDGPVTFITRSASEADDRVEVQSTERFPPSGEIVVYREVIAYGRKTPTCFEGLTRKRYDTSGFGGRTYSDLAEGEPVTLWTARCIPEKEWRTLPLPAESLQRSIGSLDSPLIRQRSTDTYVAIVRPPDRPFLLEWEGSAVLVPGECHYETCGYRLLRNGAPLGAAPLRPGETATLAAGDPVTTVAVEWSGLESRPSNPLPVPADTTLRILHDPPAGFSWTVDRWQVEGEPEPVGLVRGLQSCRAVKEVHHRYDGVIAREWYTWGTLTRRFDLNAAGQATRRLFYHQGRLFRREYFTAAGERVSREFLDPAGNVTEAILYRMEEGKPAEYDHWWFDGGMPVRRIGRAPARRIVSAAPEMYVKAGDEWVRQPYAGRRPEEAEVMAYERVRGRPAKQASEAAASPAG
jgi:hypothetical protein